MLQYSSDMKSLASKYKNQYYYRNGCWHEKNTLLLATKMFFKKYLVLQLLACRLMTYQIRAFRGFKAARTSSEEITQSSGGGLFDLCPRLNFKLELF